MAVKRRVRAGDVITGALQTFKAQFFRALAHPTRIKILEILVRGSRTVQELQDALHLAQPLVSQQLAVLRNHTILTTQKEGLSVRYALRDPLVGDLLDVARRIFTLPVRNDPEYPEGDRPEAGEAGERLSFLPRGGPQPVLDGLESADGNEDVSCFFFFAAGDEER